MEGIIRENRLPRTLRCGLSLFLAVAALLIIGGCGSPRALSSSLDSGSATAAPSAAKASIVASPNPVPASSNNTTISWNAGDSQTGGVYVSTNGAPESLFAEAKTGSQPANWIVKGTYEFRLYADKDHKKQLGTVLVKKE